MQPLSKVKRLFDKARELSIKSMGFLHSTVQFSKFILKKICSPNPQSFRSIRSTFLTAKNASSDLGKTLAAGPESNKIMKEGNCSQHNLHKLCWKELSYQFLLLFSVWVIVQVEVLPRKCCMLYSPIVLNT